MDKMPCPACVAWTCSTCGHRRNSINSMWVNPYCAKCRGTIGVRHPIVHREGRLKESHTGLAAAREPRETVREDGQVFRWPAPPLAEPVEPRHPDGTNAGPQLLGRSFAVLAQVTVAAAVTGLENESVTWSEILLCRVFNALEKTDPRDIRSCLKGVSNLVEEWTEELDRRIG